MADRIFAPGVPRHERDRLLNPFYEEERAAGNPDVNRHATNTVELADDNPIETTQQVQLDFAPVKHRHVFSYSLFVPPRLQRGAADRKIKVSLLFCVGDQMNRAGLRKVFADRDAVLITIPGWENGDRDDDGHVVAKAYGIGITDAQVKKLFTEAGLNGEPEISVIAGYSTGYRGMVGSVTAAAITLKNVRTMIFYDCLYIADDYFPGGKKRWDKRPASQKTPEILASVRTAGAIDMVLRESAKTGAKAQVVIYDTTPSGTIHYPADRVSGGPLAVNGHTVIDLKSQGANLQALQIARLVDEGAKDGFFLRSTIPSSIAAVIGTLPARGRMLSSKKTVPVGGVGSRTALEDWGSTNRSKISAVGAADRLAALKLIHKNRLMGWVPKGPFNAEGLAGEMQHDQFIPEFAGEFLVPR